MVLSLYSQQDKISKTVSDNITGLSLYSLITVINQSLNVSTAIL